jgi:eukaryotic-like serine/threonine-protein kinase
MSDPDRTVEPLNCSGPLGPAERAAVQRERAADPGATWSDLASDAGEAAGTLDSAHDLAPTSETMAHLDRAEVTPEVDGRYVELTQLGAGAMGMVALVYDIHLHRRVAQKRLRAVQHPTHVARFLREARITAQLEHPGVIPIHELGRMTDGTLYYTMKRVRGRTLRDALDSCTNRVGRLALLRHVIDVCHAVGYAHSRGVVHRDMKPENVMIGPFGETCVLDWGLAKVAGDETEEADPLASAIDTVERSTLTRAGAVVGTPAYMSPEQAAGDGAQVSARSDVWALGVVLFELVCGRRPYDGSTTQILRQIIDGPAPAPRTLEPSCPAELDAIVRKAMAIDPASRYTTATHLARELEAWREGAIVGAHRYGRLDRLRRFAESHRVALIAATAALVVGMCLVGVFVSRPSGGRGGRTRCAGGGRGQRARRPNGPA